jgi:hypothetical protein
MSLAIQAVLNKQLKSVQGYAAILSCGEGLFPIKRLNQLANAVEAADPSFNAKEIMNHIEITDCKNTDDAVDILVSENTLFHSPY